MKFTWQSDPLLFKSTPDWSNRLPRGSLGNNKPQHIVSRAAALPQDRRSARPHTHKYFPLIYLLLQRSSDVVILED